MAKYRMLIIIMSSGEKSFGYFRVPLHMECNYLEFDTSSIYLGVI